MRNFRWLLIGLVGLGVVLVLLFVSRSEYDALQADFEALQQQNESLNADYAELNSNYMAVNNELAEIKKVYPPRDFSSADELRDWLVSNDVSELAPAETIEQLYSRGLAIQEDALRDGYIISVNFEFPIYIACVAIIDGDFWWWYPDTDEPNLYPSMDKVTRD